MVPGYKHLLSKNHNICSYCYYESRYTGSHTEKEIQSAVLLRKMLLDHTESERPASVYRCQHVCTAQPSNPIDSDSIKYSTILNGSLSIDSSCGNVIIEENWIAY